MLPIGLDVPSRGRQEKRTAYVPELDHVRGEWHRAQYSVLPRREFFLNGRGVKVRNVERYK